MMATCLWVCRDRTTGDHQYALFREQPIYSPQGYQPGGDYNVRVDAVNRLGEHIAGRPLDFMECIEVVCSEVIDPELKRNRFHFEEIRMATWWPNEASVTAETSTETETKRVRKIEVRNV